MDEAFTIDEAITYLTKHGFTLESVERSESFGDCLATFIGRELRVTIAQDRGQKFIDVGLENEPLHFLDWVIKYLKQESVSAVADQQDFRLLLEQLLSYSDDIKRLLGNETERRNFLNFKRAKQAQVKASLTHSSQAIE